MKNTSSASRQLELFSNQRRRRRRRRLPSLRTPRALRRLEGWQQIWRTIRYVLNNGRKHGT